MNFQKITSRNKEKVQEKLKGTYRLLKPTALNFTAFLQFSSWLASIGSLVQGWSSMKVYSNCKNCLIKPALQFWAVALQQRCYNLEIKWKI